ncbi:type II secretion system protein [Burkholderia sp. PAMC 26561]|uniref:type II secretion system protein n=1 Tax=Burkholderia sp. PAMC 26561 TaxID=1795043 RepID=UPI00076B11B3|nr:type II secretion system protein [Burkholderia sp. PAMC 26561]AME28683.1 hypothetical protein AXG89_33400 [Burkholderia sp. PAMC 26561]
MAFSRRPRPSRQAGFTYVGTLILIAILAITVSAQLILGAAQHRRWVDQELLYRGDLYRQALQGYYLATPPGQPRYPNSLSDLLRDPRYPGIKRYLRTLYADPAAPDTPWDLITAPEGGILGVRSSSNAKPIKRANFPEIYQSFENKETYRDWAFLFMPASAGGIAAPLQIPSQ